MWRQYLESLTHDENCFVTLTYNDASLPSDGQLQPRDLQVFIREIRREIAPRRVRYFSVGEYGEENDRPHYHLSLFGVSAFTKCSHGYLPEVVAATWGKGFTSVYEFNHLTAQYVAGYTVKKLKDRKDGKFWAVPEFARMSNRPGIGAPAMATLGKQLLGTYQSWESGDVPNQLSIGQRKIPLGRYLLRMLRREVGFSEEYAKKVRDRLSWQKSVELQSLLQGVEEGATIKKAYTKDIEGKLIQVEERAKLLKKRSGK